MKLFKYIFKPKKVILVFIQFTNQGVVFLAAKKKYAIQTNFQEFETIEAIVKKFGKEFPYFIHINGSGVLTRYIDNISNYKEQLIVNGDKNDFYFSSFFTDTKIITSFFRKSLIEKQIEILKQNKVFLLSISSGISPILNLEENVHAILDYEVIIEGKEVIHFNRNETNVVYMFNSVFVDYENCISDGLLYNFENNISTFEKSIENENDITNFKDYQQLKIFGVSSVFLILLLLLGNYFYLNSLNQDLANLEVELQLQNDNVSTLDRLEQEKIRKEQLILNSGINSKAFLSFYADAIAKTCPGNIVLNEISIFPLKERLKEKRKVEIDQTLIEVLGTCSSSSSLDNWMERMNRFSWVERVELLNYSKTSENLAEFKFIILLNK